LKHASAAETENKRAPAAPLRRTAAKQTAGKICKIHRSEASPNAQIQKKKSSASIFGGKPQVGAALIKKV